MPSRRCQASFAFQKKSPKQITYPNVPVNIWKRSLALMLNSLRPRCIVRAKVDKRALKQLGKASTHCLLGLLQISGQFVQLLANLCQERGRALIIASNLSFVSALQVSETAASGSALDISLQACLQEGEGLAEDVVSLPAGMAHVQLCGSALAQHWMHGLISAQDLDGFGDSRLLFAAELAYAMQHPGHAVCAGLV